MASESASTRQVLGVLLRAHQRSATLDIILSELRRLGTLPGVATKILVTTDRPTYHVCKVIEKYEPYLFDVLPLPFPLLSPTGEHFMEAANLGLERFEKTHLDWCAIWDDDFWLEPIHATEELPRALASSDVDLWYANALFMWDESNRFNAARRHRSPLLFRYWLDDRFPLDRIIHATALAHDTAILTERTATLSTPILEYGCFTPSERLRLYRTYTEAGKVDSFISSLVAPPSLLLFPDDAVATGLMPDCRWRDLYHEYELRNTHL